MGDLYLIFKTFLCILAVGDGKVPTKCKEGDDDPSWIDIPEIFLIKSWDCLIKQIVA